MLRNLRSNVLALALSLLIPAAFTHATTFKTGKKGLDIDTDKMGKLFMAYPILFSAKGLENHKMTSAEFEGKTATVHYEGGATVLVDVSKDDQVTYVFKDVPDDVKFWKNYILFDGALVQGGTYQFGTRPAELFPAELPEKNQLFNSSASTFVITTAQGLTLTLKTPEPSYAELFDNRKWGMKNFNWSFHTPFSPETKDYTITFTVSENPATTRPSK